jgi:uncharacterized repeat protein (TIGR03806 family)
LAVAFAMLMTLPATAPMPQIDAALVASDAIPPTLSSFGFFVGAPDRPAPLLIPYTLATPLFSDHADKRRWIFLPSNTRMTANGDGLVQFPVGAAIIKSFGYAQADGSYRTIETRLLLHRANGWVALPYVWRADGSDADLALGGRRTPVTFTDPAGQVQTISYAVPNRNQCKECHGRAGVVTPIGPQLRNLELSAPHRELVSGADWQGPRLPYWNDENSGTLDSRARAYLDVNCAHCHNPAGAASNSGLFLEYQRPLGMQTGVEKRPVAAGRGSGSLDFDIVPGHPEQSILLYRMRSHEPGIAMPEVGRATTHAEGVSLIERWIAAMQ